MARHCGPCTACCTSLVIEALDKPAFTRCPHDCSGACATPGRAEPRPSGGCNIYHDRPNACRNFRCLWLDGHLSEDDRPDRLGVMFTTTTHGALGTIPMIVELDTGAADAPKIRQAIERFTRTTYVLVLTVEGGKLHHHRGPAQTEPEHRVALPVLNRAA